MSTLYPANVNIIQFRILLVTHIQYILYNYYKTTGIHRKYKGRGHTDPKILKQTY